MKQTFLGRSSRIVLDLLLRSMCHRFNYLSLDWNCRRRSTVAWLILECYVECYAPKASNANSISVRDSARISYQPRWILSRVMREKEKKRERNFWRKAKVYLAADYFRRRKFMYRVYRMASVYAFMLLYLFACNPFLSWLTRMII